MHVGLLLSVDEVKPIPNTVRRVFIILFTLYYSNLFKGQDVNRINTNIINFYKIFPD